MALPRALLREHVINRLIFKRQMIDPILEIGYGKGELFLQLAKAGRVIEGYELSIKAAQALKQQIEFDELSKAKTIPNLPNKGSYRTIIACEVIGYIDDPKSWLSKLSSLLATDGWIILSFTNKRHIGRAEILSGNMVGFEKTEIEKLARTTGYDLIHCVNYGYPLTNLLRPLLNYLYEQSAKSSPKKSDEEEVVRSGDGRKGLLTTFSEILLNQITILPFAWLQRFFSGGSLGTGFVVALRRTHGSATNA